MLSNVPRKSGVGAKGETEYDREGLQFSAAVATRRQVGKCSARTRARPLSRATKSHAAGIRSLAVHTRSRPALLSEEVGEHHHVPLLTNSRGGGCTQA